MKKLKLLFVMLVIILMAVFACGSVNAAETKNLKITHERPLDVVGQKYTVLTSSSGSQLENPIFKIIEADGTYDDILYCLRSGLGFGNRTGGEHSELTYTETYNLKSDAINVMNYYRSTIGYSIRDDEYNAILWLADNMYLPGQDSTEMRDNLLRKAGIVNSELTDNDIDFIQQMALWYFSNYDENGNENSLSLDISATVLSNRIVEYGDNEYETKREQIDALYTYLITEAQSHANEYGVGSSRNYSVVKPEVNVNSSAKQVSTVGNWTVVGPFSISETAGNIEYDFEIQVTDNSGVVIPEKEETTPIIYVVNDPDSMTPSFSSIKETVGQGQFYLKISNRLASSFDLNDANIEVIYTYDDTYLKYNTTATLWLADVADQQPVIKIDREEKKTFDLALRKYITKVNGTDILNTKNPTINTANLKNGTETTADYKHRKDPVVVKRNDKVTYKITVYNEGDIDGVVREIVDFLPEGLEFNPEDNPEFIEYKDSYTDAELVGKTFAYEYDATNRIIRILPINSEYLFELDGYDGTTLDSESIEIVCTVSVTNKTTDQILTNIATMKYAPTDLRYADIKDRDSRPLDENDDNFTLPRDWPSYGGNPSNKPDLTDSNYHYKGQEDDDDFDKVIVKGVTFDLALRKYITKVNGENIPTTKNPDIDTTELDDKTSTTAEYKHRKNPVTVKPGDFVTYKFSVYNEGDIEGIVTEIVDYLPAGLEFNPDDNPELIEYKESYTETELVGKTFAYEYNATNRTIRILPINSEYLFDLDGYDGVTLDEESLEIICKVTATNSEDDQILTNIATMKYETADGSNIPDRDSSEDNLNRPSDNDLPDYKGNEENKDDLTDREYHYKGQEDDDDFDKIKINGVQFDLALRKNITKINDVELSNTKEPNIDTDKLDNDGGTTADYKHRKDPVTVKPGDKVTYRISVYNEGEISGIVREIVDYLPEGLEFNPNDNPGLIEYKDSYTEEELNDKAYIYEYDATNRTIKILPIPGSSQGNRALLSVGYLFELAGYNGTTLNTESLEISFRVTATNKEEDQILTNIATMKYGPADGSNIPDRDSSEDDFNKPSDSDLPGYKGNDDNKDDLTDSDYHYKGQEDDDDFDKIIIKGVQFDLALRKNITKVNGVDITNSKDPNIDTSKLEDGTENTAEYKHRKDAIEVRPGDKVTYKISVYNEGEIDGIVTEIVDYLPEGLEFNPEDNPELIQYKDSYSEEELEGKTYVYEYDSSTRTIRILPLNNEYIFRLEAFDGTTLDSDSLEIICRITASVGSKDKVLTNLATMKYKPANPEDAGIEDRDSSEENINRPSDSDLPEYKGNDDNKDDLTDSDYHYKGQEDDDDFDKVIIPGVPFDLSLRKFITKVNGKNITSRIPEVDTSKLNTMDSTTGKRITTATYTHSKEPVIVKKGDIVTFTFRVYNEGQIDGYAEEISDYLPEGLGYIMDYKTNTDNLWVPVVDNTTKVMNLVGTEGVYSSESTIKNLTLSEFDSNRVSSLSDVKIVVGKAKLSSSAIEYEKIKAYNPDLTSADIDISDDWQKSTNGEDGLYYRDVEVTCIVLAENTFKGQLRNIAEIQKNNPVDEHDNPIEVEDRDSTPDNVDTDDYTPPEDNSSYQEDDDDYEPLELRYFDLALRKFITAVNDEAITTRIPDPTVKSDGEIEYIHDKTPIYVANSDIVTYTIRVYNEGTVLGYAMEISDDIPDGLEFLPNHDTNKEYKWVMLDEDGNETDNPEEAVEIRTKYLENSLLRPYDPTKDISDVDPLNPDYAEVKVAFKVVDKKITQPDRIIINKAQITEDKPVDEDGNELDIPDEDSIPDEWNPGEDDQDIEKIYVKKFDLALLKWVTKTIVTVDGKTTTTETGFTPYDDPEPVAKVVIDKKKLNKTTVKFVYNIIIFNQGEIAGYATEITDYIPAGLEFHEEDNPIWTKEGEGKITTRALEGVLLQPGESATIEVVFRWKQGANNLGLKTNIAEISEDYNDKGAPDIDSTPDNVITPDYEEQQEDDDDRALVILELKTGGFKASYLWVGLIFVTIIAGGIITIKKFVI